MLLSYYPGCRCPGCNRSHWIIGRVTAECCFCGTALPLADSNASAERRISLGKGGGKISRCLVAA